MRPKRIALARLSYSQIYVGSLTRTRTWKYGIKIRCVTNYTMRL